MAGEETVSGSGGALSERAARNPRLTSMFLRRPGRDALPDAPEFSHYAAVKFHVYRRVVEGAMARLAGHAPDRVPVSESITVRKIRHELRLGRRSPDLLEDGFLDFVDTTPHAFRERMRMLNHGSFLTEHGRGLRGAVEYRWTEPILYSNVCSYLALNRLLNGRFSYALDIYRLREAFNRTPFTAREFRDLFQYYREMQSLRRWYGVRGGLHEGAFLRFVESLVRRLNRFAQLGFLVADNRAFRLTDRALEVAHWFDLFTHSVAYRPSERQGSECALRVPCANGTLGRALGIPSGGCRRVFAPASEG